jgi:opacity protein-like surface antigen
MRRHLKGTLVVAACLLGAGVADAQPIQLQFTGLPPGARIEIVLAAANLNKTETALAAPSGALDFVLDFANLGKAQLAEREPIEVYILSCRDDRPVRVAFVAEGGQAPQECDEKRADTGDGCSCRRGAFILLRNTRALRINAATAMVTVIGGQPVTAAREGSAWSGRRFAIAFGGEYVRDTTKKLSDRAGFTRTSGTLENATWSGAFAAEYWPSAWLGLGYGYFSAGAVEADEAFTFQANPNATLTVRETFDPSVQIFYVAVRGSVGRRVSVFGGGGFNRMTADYQRTETARFGSITQSMEFPNDFSGTGPALLAGLDMKLAGNLGARVHYRWVKLKAESGGSSVNNNNQGVGLLVVLSLP